MECLSDVAFKMMGGRGRNEIRIKICANFYMNFCATTRYLTKYLHGMFAGVTQCTAAAVGGRQ